MLDVTLVVNSDNGVETFHASDIDIEGVLNDIKEQVTAAQRLYTA